MTEAAVNLHLLRLPGVGPVGLRKILARFAAIGASPAELMDLPVETLSDDLKFTPEQISALHYADHDPESDLKDCADKGIQVLLPSDPQYPAEKLSILGRGRPALLFASGNLDLLQYPALGFSGSRNATEESLRQTTDLCEQVAAIGWVIVSGGARGVDEAAHLAAVRSGPGTIIMLPTGVFQLNLRRELRKHLAEDKTLLLSEFPPEQGWTAGCAMQRNRLIAAASHGLVLVEPGIQGGTVGTGKLAQKMGVPLYLLWNEATWGRGTDAFYRTGAQPVSLTDFDPAEFISVVKFRWQESERLRRQTFTADLFE